mgnify:CR=1 FL=1
MLSGGAALGIYHMGVVKSLWENGLLPHVISGSSAGSIVAAMLGTHNDEELREVMTHRESLVGLIKWNSPPRGYLFDVEHFSAKLKERIREMSFQEAFRHSGRAINITVSAYGYLVSRNILLEKVEENARNQALDRADRPDKRVEPGGRVERDQVAVVDREHDARAFDHHAPAGHVVVDEGHVGIPS